MDLLIARVRKVDEMRDAFHLEETLQQFICPMRIRGDDPSRIEVSDHDLWVVDERLTFAKYFASDVPVFQLVADVTSTERPDILVWDRLHGLGIDGDEPLKRVMLIEFKKPGRRDYDERYSPMNQVSRYLTQLVNGEIEGLNRQRDGLHPRERNVARERLLGGEPLGLDPQRLAALNRDAVGMLLELKAEYVTADTPVLISGCIGPRGDGYDPGRIMSVDEAAAYHRSQVEVLVDAGADILSALTITNVPEAVGIVLAAKALRAPAVISFTVETDGRLPTGDALGDAIEAVDVATGGYPVYYMINCAHPVPTPIAMAPIAAPPI